MSGGNGKKRNELPTTIVSKSILTSIEEQRLVYAAKVGSNSTGIYFDEEKRFICQQKNWSVDDVRSVLPVLQGTHPYHTHLIPTGRLRAGAYSTRPSFRFLPGIHERRGENSSLSL